MKEWFKVIIFLMIYFISFLVWIGMGLLPLWMWIANGYLIDKLFFGLSFIGTIVFLMTLCIPIFEE